MVENSHKEYILGATREKMTRYVCENTGMSYADLSEDL